MVESTTWAAPIATLLAAFKPEIVAATKFTLQRAKSETIARVPRAFSEYLLQTAVRLASVSTLLKDEPQPLYECYEPLNVSLGNTEIPNSSASAFNTPGTRAIIVGRGGSGKSMMMRHLFLDCIAQSSALPLFLELRDINHQEGGIADLLSRHLRNRDTKVPAEIVFNLSAKQRCLLLLDGLDEVSTDKRQDVANEIDELADKYSQLAIVVSSRPEDELRGWENFRVFSVAPLSLDKACNLLKRVNYDPDTTERLINDLRRGLFERHFELLSNPLLLTIMLVTYRTTSSIPSKRYLFFEYAFDAMFRHHDAIKRGFQREFQADLSPDDFARVVSAVAFVSYSAHKVDFTATEFNSYARAASRLESIAVHGDRLLHDLRRCVSLMIKDGLHYRFVHRSFQEYFAACFLSNAEPEIITAAVSRIATRMVRDNVAEYFAEKDPRRFGLYVVIPFIEWVFDIVKYKHKIYKSTSDRWVRLTPYKISIDWDDAEDGCVVLKWPPGVAKQKWNVPRMMRIIRSVYAQSEVLPGIQLGLDQDELVGACLAAHDAMGLDPSDNDIPIVDALSIPNVQSVLERSWFWDATPIGLQYLVAVYTQLMQEYQERESALSGIVGP